MEETKKRDWSRGWMDRLDPEKLILDPLQLANCKRMEENDAVYIFDEVGCGKTISAGLMALHYLSTPSARDVLVITDNSVKGQFRQDWLHLLPFQELGFMAAEYNTPDDRVHVSANLHHQLKEAGRLLGRFGLIIIDEAHVFLNRDTQRYSFLLALKNQQPEKVVFLTATPIRDDLWDLRSYVNTASRLLGRRQPDGWIQEVSGAQDPKTVLCSRFDPAFPATRYFKDTANALSAPKSAAGSKPEPRRCVPLLWKYKPNLPAAPLSIREWEKAWLQAKHVALEEGIKAVLEQNKGPRNLPDRFVVFACRVEDKEGVYGLGERLKGFAKGRPDLFPKGAGDVETVTGFNRDEALERYRALPPHQLPRILVLNFQIGERGINLPNYNYVINYHIPDNPAALEQRFGRIDRRTSSYDEIHMCYLIRDSDYWDTNTKNFYTALGRYRSGLLPYLPAKNTILCGETLAELRSVQEKVQKKRDSFVRLFEGPERRHTLDACKKYCQKYGPQPALSPEDPLSQLIYFCRDPENDLWWDPQWSEEQAFVTEVKRCLSRMVNRVVGAKRGQPPSAKELEESFQLLESVSNQIFFRRPPIIIHPIEDCAQAIRAHMASLPSEEPWTAVLTPCSLS